MQLNKHKLISIVRTIILVSIITSPFVAMAAGIIPPQIVPADCKDSLTCGWPQVIELMNNVVSFLLFGLAAPLAVLSFAYAGFLYITAAGDTGKISKAHDIFRKVLLGMIFAFGAWVLVKAILTGLLGSNQNFNQLVK
jgi:hypothetical protein